LLEQTLSTLSGSLSHGYRFFLNYPDFLLGEKYTSVVNKYCRRAAGRAINPETIVFDSENNVISVGGQPVQVDETDSDVIFRCRCSYMRRSSSSADESKTCYHIKYAARYWLKIYLERVLEETRNELEALENENSESGGNICAE